MNKTMTEERTKNTGERGKGWLRQGEINAQNG